MRTIITMITLIEPYRCMQNAIEELIKKSEEIKKLKERKIKIENLKKIIINKNENE
jgi:hypothetical protein